MRYSFREQVMGKREENVRNGRRRRWIGLLAVLMAVSTLYGLLLPAFTLEKPTFCGLEGHVHTDACYETADCPLPEGPGHTHSDACYETVRQLICGLEESGDHQHTDACWQESRELTCSQEEREAHTHSDACAGRHLVCQKPEHEHTLACYSNPGADLENEQIWLRTFPTFTDETAAERVVALAKSQLGYRESTANYAVAGEELKGYTRYGAWYGDPYGDWCAMFASFCLHYAGIDASDMPYEAGCTPWITALEERGLYVSSDEAEGYIPTPGDLIFFHNTQGEGSGHVGVITAFDDGKQIIAVIEGNCANRVQEQKYALEDTSVMGYGLLPDSVTGTNRELAVVVPPPVALKKAPALRAGQTIDLEPMLTGVELIGEDNNPLPRPWVVDPSESYHLQFHFAENSGHQFADDTTPMVYQMPEGVDFGDAAFTGTFEITIPNYEHADGRDGKVAGNTYTYDPATRTFTFAWNTEDPDFAQLPPMNNVAFNLDVTAHISTDQDQIQFSDDVSVDIKEYHLATIEKTGSYDPATGVATYTLTVKSEGKSKDVVVTDDLIGSILDYNHDVSWSGNSADPTLTETANGGFQLTFPTMEDGEEITITYTANIDFDSDTWSESGTNLPGGGNALVATEEQTKNTATLTAKDNLDQESSWKFDNVTKETLKKEGTWELDPTTGNKIIHWTVTVNEEAKTSLAGKTITDIIRSGDAAFTDYDTSTPLKITVKNADGTTETRTINWENTDSFTYSNADNNTSWHYTVPADDGLCSYTFTYDTIVKADEYDGAGVSNEIKVGEHGRTTTVKEGYGIDKRGKTNAEYTDWTIQLTVPAYGATSAELVDLLPTMQKPDGSGLFVDQLDTDYNEDGYQGGVKVEGLAPGESYVVSQETDPPSVAVTFYQDESHTTEGLKGTGAERTITVHVRTNVDEEWLATYPSTGPDPAKAEHTNHAEFYVNQSTEAYKDEAKVTPAESGLVKNGHYLTSVTINGEKYPVYQYDVTFNGLEGILQQDGHGGNRKIAVIHEDFDARLRYLDVTNDDDRAILEAAGADTNLAERLRIDGSSGVDNKVGLPATWNESAGTFTFSTQTTNGETQIPRIKGNKFAPQYEFTYYLIVKEDALHDLQASVDKNNTAVDLNNTISYPNGDSSTAKVQFVYNPVQKTMDRFDEVNHTAHYRIVLNSQKERLHSGEPMTVTDTYTNLSVDYQTITITTDPADRADQVTWNYSGNTGTFIIPDETQVIIEYDARVIGNVGDSVTFENTASVLTYSDSTSTEKTLDSQGSGSGENFRVRLFKHLKDNMNVPVEGAVFQLFTLAEDGKTEVPVTFLQNGTGAHAVSYKDGQISSEHSEGDCVYFVTGDDGFVTVQLDQHTDGVALNKDQRYFLVEVKAPYGYQISSVHWSFMISDTADYSQYVFYNNDIVRVTDERWPMKIKKIGVDENENILSDALGGAVFTIYTDPRHTKVAEVTEPPETPGGESRVRKLENLQSADADGLIFEGNLPVGTYYIVETQAPDGYNRMGDHVILRVTPTEIKTQDQNSDAVISTDEKGAVTLTLKNHAGYELPKTGGMGTVPYTLGGAALLTAGIGWSFRLRRRRERGDAAR